MIVPFKFKNVSDESLFFLRCVNQKGRRLAGIETKITKDGRRDTYGNELGGSKDIELHLSQSGNSYHFANLVNKVFRTEEKAKKIIF